MTEARRDRLERLTDRWRGRHDARRQADPLQPADPARAARAEAFFPWLTTSPAEYAATYGAAMTGYTYDAYTYDDPALQAWLHELGDLLRLYRRRC
jgi:hypothetical protein